MPSKELVEGIEEIIKEYYHSNKYIGDVNVCSQAIAERLCLDFSKTKLYQLMVYGFPRAVGHTYSEINGVKNNSTALLIVADARQKDNLSKYLPREKMITLSEIPDRLRGLRKALVIDHFALAILVATALSTAGVIRVKEKGNEK